VGPAGAGPVATPAGHARPAAIPCSPSATSGEPRVRALTIHRRPSPIFLLTRFTFSTIHRRRRLGLKGALCGGNARVARLTPSSAAFLAGLIPVHLQIDVAATSGQRRLRCRRHARCRHLRSFSLGELISISHGWSSRDLQVCQSKPSSLHCRFSDSLSEITC
jgi:hypothetical protein